MHATPPGGQNANGFAATPRWGSRPIPKSFQGSRSTSGRSGWVACRRTHHQLAVPAIAANRPTTRRVWAPIGCGVVATRALSHLPQRRQIHSRPVRYDTVVAPPHHQHRVGRVHRRIPASSPAPHHRVGDAIAPGRLTRPGATRHRQDVREAWPHRRGQQPADKQNFVGQGHPKRRPAIHAVVHHDPRADRIRHSQTATAASQATRSGRVMAACIPTPPLAILPEKAGLHVESGCERGQVTRPIGHTTHGADGTRLVVPEPAQVGG